MSLSISLLEIKRLVKGARPTVRSTNREVVSVTSLREIAAGEVYFEKKHDLRRERGSPYRVLQLRSLDPFSKVIPVCGCPDVQAPPFPPLASASVTHPPLGLPPLVCGTRSKTANDAVFQLRQSSPCAFGAPLLPSQGGTRVTPAMLRSGKVPPAGQSVVCFEKGSSIGSKSVLKSPARTAGLFCIVLCHACRACDGAGGPVHAKIKGGPWRRRLERLTYSIVKEPRKTHLFSPG